MVLCSRVFCPTAMTQEPFGPVSCCAPDLSTALERPCRALGRPVVTQCLCEVVWDHGADRSCRWRRTLTVFIRDCVGLDPGRRSLARKVAAQSSHGRGG